MSQVWPIESGTGKPLDGRYPRESITSISNTTENLRVLTPEEEATRAIYEARQVYLAFCLL